MYSKGMVFFCSFMCEPKSLQVGVKFLYSCFIFLFFYSKESEIDQTLNLTLYMQD